MEQDGILNDVESFSYKQLDTSNATSKVLEPGTRKYKLRGHEIAFPVTYTMEFDLTLMFAMLEVNGMKALQSMYDNGMTIRPDLKVLIEDALKE